MLSSQLTDRSRSKQARIEAAKLLLQRNYPQAIRILQERMIDNSDPTCQIAICQAIIQTGIARKQFVAPLLAILKNSSNPAVRASAADALIVHRRFGSLDRMIKLLMDRKTNPNTKITIISALSKTLDKRAVEALVVLTADRDKSVRHSACMALVEMTNITTFDEDSKKWKSWWENNKQKSDEAWTMELAKNLIRRNIALSSENSKLRQRLANTMEELFITTAPKRRDALILKMLKDKLAEVRLVGIKAAKQYINAGAKPSKELRKEILAKITDTDSRIRAIAALLLPSISRKDAATILHERLKVEKSPRVRKALYESLMLTEDTSQSTWNQLVAGISEDDPLVAAAAADAMVKFIENSNLTDVQRMQLSTKLVQRYRQSANEGKKSTRYLREALLGVMGALKDEKLADVIISSLKDPAATVRLSGVRAIKQLGSSKYIPAIIPLVKDPDRGVRMVAIATIGALGNSNYVETILERTEKSIEPDADVRSEAWRTIMKLLKKDGIEKLNKITQKLAQRPDARSHLIDILKLWVDKIPADEPNRWIPVRLQLAEALLSAGRPAEAASELAKIYPVMAKTADKRAGEVWIKWITAMLTADDPAAIVQIAKAPGKEQFNRAIAAIKSRLKQLEKAKNFAAMIKLAKATLVKLDKKLTDDEKKEFTEILTRAKTNRRLIIAQRVKLLLPKLTSTDQQVRQSTLTELKSMAPDAIPLLVEHLRKTITSKKPDPALEKAIVEALSTLAPNLKGYDRKAALADKIKILQKWLKQLGS